MVKFNPIQFKTNVSNMFLGGFVSLYVGASALSLVEVSYWTMRTMLAYLGRAVTAGVLQVKRF